MTGAPARLPTEAVRQLGDGGLGGRRLRRRRPSWRQRCGAAWHAGELARRGVLATPLLAAVFAIWAFGGVYGWAYGLAYLMIFSALAAWSVQVLRGRWTFRWQWLYLAVALFAAYIVVQLLGHVTTVAGSTVTAALHLSAAAALFIVVTQLYRPERDATWLGTSVAVVAAALALLAVLQILTGYNGIYWHFTYAFANPAGSFVNKNHFAGCMELLLPIAVVEGYRRRRQGLLRQIPWVLGPGLGVVAVLLAASRGGAVSLLAELIGAVALILFLERRRLRGMRHLPDTAVANLWMPVPTEGAAWSGAANRRHARSRVAEAVHERRATDRLVLPAGLFALLVSLLLVFTLVIAAGTEKLQARLQNVNGYAPDAVQRTDLNLSSEAMWRQRRWLGWGLGTWADVYPAYARFTDEAVYEFAHNDYLQLLAETGLVGVGCVALFWGLWLWQFGRRMAVWAPLGTAPPEVAMALAAAIACLGIFVHSWVDFNLHIPANLLLFFTMAALALPG